MRLSNSIRLIVLDNGRMMLPRRSLVAQTDKAVVDFDLHVQVPVYAVLICHPDGLILFDAGCHPNSMGPAGRWSSTLQSEFPWRATEQDMLLSRLSECGIQPSHIRYVVCSHLHCDHAGNLEYFPDSEIIVHSDEWAAAMHEYNTNVKDGEFVYDDISAWLNQKLHFRLIPPDMASMRLFPEITIHNLGRGHSYGMLALEVQSTERGTVILGSDAAFAAAFYGDNGIAPRLSLDPEGYINGTRALARLENSCSGEVWFGHDLEQFLNLKKYNVM